MKKACNVPYVPTHGTDKEAIKKSVQRLVDKDVSQGEPFIVIDLGNVYRKHKQWQRMLPRAQPFYAVKCCNEQRIVESLVSLGLSFDCASKAEIEQVMKLGVPASKIIFANPAKSIAHIKFAREVGVDLMTFDNEIELLKVREHHPNARMVLRILADDPTAVCQVITSFLVKFLTHQFGIKFGVAPSCAFDVLKSAKALGIDVVGVSFHVGSGCQNPEAYHDAVGSARRVFNEGLFKDFNLSVS